MSVAYAEVRVVLRHEPCHSLKLKVFAKKLGISAATFSGYKAKDFISDPKPKGRKKE